jgi:phage gp36-like protein
MAYCTQTDIQHAAGGSDRLVELADYDGDGSVDAAVITSVQAEVDGWIDSYFALRYSVPVDSPTSTVVQLAAAECVYRLKGRRQGLLGDDDRREHDERKEWLLHAAKGLVRPSDPAPAAGDAVRSAVVVNNRDVSRANLKGFV